MVLHAKPGRRFVETPGGRAAQPFHQERRKGVGTGRKNTSFNPHGQGAARLHVARPPYRRGPRVSGAYRVQVVSTPYPRRRAVRGLRVGTARAAIHRPRHYSSPVSALRNFARSDPSLSTTSRVSSPPTVPMTSWIFSWSIPYAIPGACPILVFTTARLPEN